MNKSKKFIIGILSLSMLMMMAASVSADEEEPGVLDRTEEDSNAINEDDMVDTSTEDEPNLIAPSPETGEGSLIAQIDTTENKDTSSKSGTTNVIIVIGIAGAVGLATALIIIKNKN